MRSGLGSSNLLSAELRPRTFWIVVACVVLAVNERFVTYWVGKAEYGDFVHAFLLLTAMLVRHSNRTLVASLICYGKEMGISLTTFSDEWGTLATPVIAIHSFRLAAAVGIGYGTLVLTFFFRESLDRYTRPRLARFGLLPAPARS
jgi:hypothetical protein